MLFDFIYFILYYGLIIVPLIGTVVGAVFFRKLSTDYKYLWVYVFIGFLFQFTFYLLVLFSQTGYNYFLIPFFGFFELILFTLLYIKFFELQKPLWLWAVILVFSILLIIEGIDASIKQDPFSYISFGRVIGKIMVILYSVTYIVRYIQDKSKKMNAQRVGLSFVLLSYFSITFIHDAAMSFMMTSNTQFVKWFIHIHAFVVMLFYIYLTFRFWEYRKIQTQTGTQSGF